MRHGFEGMLAVLLSLCLADGGLRRQKPMEQAEARCGGAAAAAGLFAARLGERMAAGEHRIHQGGGGSRRASTLMYENAEQKQDRQIKAIRSFIAYQVDVIAFSPIIETGWDNVLQEAKDAGIPVITTDRMISTEDESLWAGFVGSDFYQEGVSAGEFLLRKMARPSRM